MTRHDNHGIERCLICNYHEASELYSLLGTPNVCFECIEHRAEKPILIHQESQNAYKRPSGDPIRSAIIRTLKLVTCWAGADIGYLPLIDYEARVAKQMPVPRTEDDEIAERMVKRLQEIRKGIDDRRIVMKRSRCKTLMARIAAIFRPLTEAIEAGV